MLHVHLVSLAFAAITLAAAGCGGSSKAESTNASTISKRAATNTTASTAATTAATLTVKIAPGTPLARTQWLTRSDAICRHFDAELNAIDVKGLQEVPRALPQVAAYQRAEVAQLAKPAPPCKGKRLAAIPQRDLTTGR